jgi:hypothetical protein
MKQWRSMHENSSLCEQPNMNGAHKSSNRKNLCFIEERKNVGGTPNDSRVGGGSEFEWFPATPFAERSGRAAQCARVFAHRASDIIVVHAPSHEQFHVNGPFATTSFR